MAHRDTRDFGFFEWAGVDILLALGMVAILSIGAPFFLVGLILLGVMLGRDRVGQPALERRPAPVWSAWWSG